MKSIKPCKYCDKTTHYSFQCFTIRKPIKPISNKSKQKHADLKQEWLKYNPPINGSWSCYLQISPRCIKLLSDKELVLEHVKSRASHPELKYDISNIKAACRDCNRIKDGLSIDTLSMKYPHLSDLI